MAPLMIDKAYLIGIWVESLLYGVNFILVCACIYVLTAGRKKQEGYKFFVGFLSSQFLLSTASAALGLRIIVVAFINQDQRVATIAYISAISNPLRVAKTVVISLNSILSDGILVWRVYRVWGKNWKVTAFPTALLLSTIACTIGQTLAFIRARTMNQDIYLEGLKRWNISLYAVSIATNFVGTALIVFRIWSMLRSSSLAFYRRLLMLIIESGMVYTFVLMLMITLYAAHDNSFYVIYETLGQISSITPCSILLVVGLKLTTAGDPVRMSVGVTSSASGQYRGYAGANNAPLPRAIPLVETSNRSEEFDFKLISHVSNVQGNNVEVKTSIHGY